VIPKATWTTFSQASALAAISAAPFESRAAQARA